jgi:hypothetical protein
VIEVLELREFYCYDLSIQPLDAQYANGGNILFHGDIY